MLGLCHRGHCSLCDAARWVLYPLLAAMLLLGFVAMVLGVYSTFNGVR